MQGCEGTDRKRSDTFDEVDAVAPCVRCVKPGGGIQAGAARKQTRRWGFSQGCERQRVRKRSRTYLARWDVTPHEIELSPTGTYKYGDNSKVRCVGNTCDTVLNSFTSPLKEATLLVGREACIKHTRWGPVLFAPGTKTCMLFRPLKEKGNKKKKKKLHAE